MDGSGEMMNAGLSLISEYGGGCMGYCVGAPPGGGGGMYGWAGYGPAPPG